MEENPYHPLDGKGKAASETSFTVNLSALILSVCVLGICLSMGMRNLTHLFVVLLVSLLVFSVGLERLLYPETSALGRLALVWARVPRWNPAAASPSAAVR